MGKLRKVKKLLNSGRKIRELSNDELVKLAESGPFKRLTDVLEDEMTDRLIAGSKEMKDETAKAVEVKQGTFFYSVARGFKQWQSNLS